MENEYRPFFSRKHLNVLMWFSLLAILVLSSLGPSDVKYHDIEHNKEQNLYWMELDDQLNTLTFLFPSQSALSRSHKQLQQLKAQIILSRLNSLNNKGFTYNVYPRQDRIELSLHWAKGQELPDITQLMGVLKQPVEPSRWQKVLKTLNARDYLDTKAIEEQAIEAFYAQFQPPVSDILALLPESYNELFQGMKFVLSGHKADALAEQMMQLPLLTQSATMHSPLNSSINSSITALPGHLRLQSQFPDSYVLLTGEAIPKRADSEFIAYRLAAQTVKNLLQSQRQTFNYEYRLLWGALQDIGYRAVIIKTAQSPEAILQQLQQLLDENLVEQSQKQLSEQWQERMRDLSNQIQAMNLIAFYALPPATMENYVELIEEADEESVLKLSRKALDTGLDINIMLSPSY